MTCATAPAIATDVASTTLPVDRYSTRNTMAERKSVLSLTNTSFIVSSLVFPGIAEAPRAANARPLNQYIELWIASRSLSSGAHSRAPLSQNDDLDNV